MPKCGGTPAEQASSALRRAVVNFIILYADSIWSSAAKIKKKHRKNRKIYGGRGQKNNAKTPEKMLLQRLNEIWVGSSKHRWTIRSVKLFLTFSAIFVDPGDSNNIV